MKTKKQFIITFWVMILFLMTTGCGHQDLSTEDMISNVDETEELGEEAIMIRSREEARMHMEVFLNDKYGEKYDVNLPGQNESGDYVATACVKNGENSQLIVAVNPLTGECRDSRCILDIQRHLEKTLQEQAAVIWERAKIQVRCQFGNEVPDHDWYPTDSAEDILLKEDVNGGICMMIPCENISVNEESARIARMLKTEAMEGFFCEIDVYYVSENVYAKSEEQMVNGKVLSATDAAEEYIHRMRTFTKISITQDYLEDIQHGFGK